MASTEKLTQPEKKEFKMALSSWETPWDSVLDKGVDLLGSTSLSPICDMRVASHAPFGPPIDKWYIQILTKQPWSRRECPNSSEESSSKGNVSTCLSFLKKLWDVVESHQFKSIWWGDNGKCVVIREELFEEEVLARRGHLRIFEIESMRSFAHHLHLYGFATKLRDFPKSGSRNDLLAEETARKFHFYYNPNFRTHFPYKLMKYKQSFAPKVEHQQDLRQTLIWMHADGKEKQMWSWWGKPVPRRRAAHSQQVQGRTRTPLLPGRPHLPSDVPRQLPESAIHKLHSPRE